MDLKSKGIIALVIIAAGIIAAVLISVLAGRPVLPPANSAAPTGIPMGPTASYGWFPSWEFALSIAIAAVLLLLKLNTNLFGYKEKEDEEKKKKYALDEKGNPIPRIDMKKEYLRYRVFIPLAFVVILFGLIPEMTASGAWTNVGSLTRIIILSAIVIMATSEGVKLSRYSLGTAATIILVVALTAQVRARAGNNATGQHIASVIAGSSQGSKTTQLPITQAVIYAKADEALIRPDDSEPGILVTKTLFREGDYYWISSSRKALIKLGPSKPIVLKGRMRMRAVGTKGPAPVVVRVMPDTETATFIQIKKSG